MSVGTTVPTHRLLTLALTIGAALAVPTSAHAAPKLLLDATSVLDAPLSANAGEDTGACQRAYRPDAPGVAHRDVRLPAAGSLEVRLDGRQGDWDVAVFDAAGTVLAADASPDAQEVAGVVAFLASEGGAAFTGVPVTMDMGWTAR